jgi:hypothetical protein
MTVCCTLGTMAKEEEKYENIKTETGLGMGIDDSFAK